MTWLAVTAARTMWSEMDKNASNGEMMQFFARHLQAAYEAGRRDEQEEAYEQGLATYGPSPKG